MEYLFGRHSDKFLGVQLTPLNLAASLALSELGVRTQCARLSGCQATKERQAKHRSRNSAAAVPDSTTTFDAREMSLNLYTNSWLHGSAVIRKRENEKKRQVFNAHLGPSLVSLSLKPFSSYVSNGMTLKILDSYICIAWELHFLVNSSDSAWHSSQQVESTLLR